MTREEKQVDVMLYGCDTRVWHVPDVPETPMQVKVRAMLRNRTLRGYMHDGCSHRLVYVEDERYVIGVTGARAPSDVCSSPVEDYREGGGRLLVLERYRASEGPEEPRAE